MSILRINYISANLLVRVPIQNEGTHSHPTTSGSTFYKQISAIAVLAASSLQINYISANEYLQYKGAFLYIEKDVLIPKVFYMKTQTFPYIPKQKSQNAIRKTMFQLLH
jgi:hypothetical protein